MFKLRLSRLMATTFMALMLFAPIGYAPDNCTSTATAICGD